VAPLSLLPCPSLNDTTACFAVASDAQDGDLTGEIAWEDVSCSDPDDPDCMTCTPLSMTLGACLPSFHTLRYYVTDSNGNTAEAYAKIEVAGQGNRTTAVFQIPTNATTLAAAQAIRNASLFRVEEQQALAQIWLPTLGYNISRVRARSPAPPPPLAGTRTWAVLCKWFEGPHAVGPSGSP